MVHELPQGAATVIDIREADDDGDIDVTMT